MSEEIEVVDGIAVSSQKPGFDAADLVECDKCGRANAPNRTECLYCGAGLKMVAGEAELKLREVEPWEPAFNLVLFEAPIEPPKDPGFPFHEVIRRTAGLSVPIPLGRVATQESAFAAQEALKRVGIAAVIIEDVKLDAGRPPVRLRSLDNDGVRVKMTTFNTNESIVMPCDKLEWIVKGRLFEERSEQTLKKKRRSVKEVATQNATKDEAAADLYFAGHLTGFRIMESGFDFSCLGGEKSMVAGENIKRLLANLERAVPSARVSDDYLSKRSLLEDVWPSTERNESKGMQRASFGVSISRAMVRSNVEQFTKYSRLVLSFNEEEPSPIAN